MQHVKLPVTRSTTGTMKVKRDSLLCLNLLKGTDYDVKSHLSNYIRMQQVRTQCFYILHSGVVISISVLENSDNLCMKFSRFQWQVELINWVTAWSSKQHFHRNDSSCTNYSGHNLYDFRVRIHSFFRISCFWYQLGRCPLQMLP